MILDKPNKNHTLKWLFSQIRNRIWAMLVLMASNVAGSILTVVFSLAMRNVVNSAVGGDHSAFYGACIGLGLLFLGRVLCNGLSLHLNERLQADLDRDMKRNLIHKILHSEFSEVTRFHSGDLVHRLNGDVSSICQGVLAVVSSMTTVITGLVTAVAILLQMAPGFTVAIIIISIGVALLSLLIQRRMKELHKQASSASGKISGFYQEIIGKLLIIQALDVSAQMEERSDRVLENRWQIQRRRKNMSLAMTLGSNALSFVGSFVTLIWCGSQLLQGTMTYGDMTAMTSLVSQLQTPMLTLPAIIPKIISISAACERLMEIENIPSQPQSDGRRAKELYENMRGISAKNLTFAYDRDPVINHVSLTIPKGGLTVIVGASGIGKSTLLKLMLGIYRPVSGDLVIDTAEGEIPISRGARSLFSYAPQGNLLLSGTLRDNLLLSRPDATEEEIHQALYVSAMDEYIATLPDGLDTALGENGAGLSEGQAQRISLARAVLSGAPILLLDEVTSSLDPQTERIVLERICALPGKTCIAVTHRPAALELADRKITVTETDMTISEIVHSV